QIGSRIGKEPSADIGRAGAGVEDLDPVGRIAILIAQTTGIAREEFRNRDRLGGRHALRRERCQYRAEPEDIKTLFQRSHHEPSRLSPERKAGATTPDNADNATNATNGKNHTFSDDGDVFTNIFWFDQPLPGLTGLAFGLTGSFDQ